jgi:hypothetical protein
VKEPEAVIHIHQAIMEKIAAIPGVTSIGLTSLIPMTNSGWHDPVFAADKNYEKTQLPAIRSFKFLSPGLLKTMGNALVAGRDFTWEDAIRMALGAQRAEVTRMFVRYGVGLTAVGVACGLAAAIALTRLMGSLLFEVSPVDPITYLAVCVSLMSAAVLASYVPALRATTVNPAVTALRSE